MTPTTDINIEFFPKQLTAYEILANTNVCILGYGGAKGGGKSFFGRTNIILDLLKTAGTSGLIIRKTFSELERNHIKKIKQEWPNFVYDYKEQKHIFELFNGSQLDLTYCENVKDLERLQGAEYEFILIDETEHFSEIFFKDICACLRTILGVKCYIIVTFNPGGIGHCWLKRLFITKDFAPNENSRDYDFVKATVYDNPKIDKAYVDKLKSLPEKKRKAWLDGDFDSFIGQYFSNFGEHLKSEPFVIPPHMCETRLFGSMDYGYGTNGFSSFGLWYVINGVPIRLFTWYRQGMVASEQADDLYDYLTSFYYTGGSLPMEVYCDNNMWTSAGLDGHETAPIDYFKAKFPQKVTWTPANKNRINGWQVVLDYFSCDKLTGKPKLLYWSKYNKTFEDYFPILVSDDNRPEDVKKCEIDHTADETRYGLTAIKMKTVRSISEEAKNLSSTNMSRQIANALSLHAKSETGF